MACQWDDLRRRTAKRGKKNIIRKAIALNTGFNIIDRSKLKIKPSAKREAENVERSTISIPPGKKVHPPKKPPPPPKKTNLEKLPEWAKC